MPRGGALTTLGWLTVTAVLWGLAYPAPGWWPLAYVALVPAVVVVLRTQRPRRTLLCAWLVAFAWWLVMIRWMIPVTGGGYAALSAFLAGYFPLALWIARRLHRDWDMPQTFALPLAWVSVELLRGAWPAGGFGWFALGHSQAPIGTQPGLLDHAFRGPLIQCADLFGELTVSVLVCMSGGLIVDTLLRPLYRPDPGHRRGRRAERGVVLARAAWVVVFVPAWGYGLYRTHTHPGSDDRPVRVALIQTNVAQDNRNDPTPEQVRSDWDRLLALTRQAGRDRPSLIVWPETVVPAPLDDDSIRYHRPSDPRRPGAAEADQAIAALARELHATLIVGAHSVRWSLRTDEQGRQWVRPERWGNAAYCYTPGHGRSPEHYDKMHRVPFGEYVPWVEGWPWLKKRFIRWLTPYGDFDYTIIPGLRPVAFDTKVGDADHDDAMGEYSRGLRMVTPICFEDAVPRVVRRMVRECSERFSPVGLIVNLTNDGWFAGTDQPEQHLQIAVFRSIENRRPTVRAVNTGVSAAIDPSGRVTAVQPAGSEGVLRAVVRLPSGGWTWYGYWGDGPMWALTLGTWAMVALGVLRRRTRKG